MQAMLHSAFSVGASTIFASLVAESVAASAPFAILLVVVGAAIPSLTAIYLANKSAKLRLDAAEEAQKVIDRAAGEAKAIIEAAAREAVVVVREGKAHERTRTRGPRRVGGGIEHPGGARPAPPPDDPAPS